MITVVGTPNWQRFAETWLSIIAAKEGQEIEPGSVRVELKGDRYEGKDEAPDR